MMLQWDVYPVSVLLEHSTKLTDWSRQIVRRRVLVSHTKTSPLPWLTSQSQPMVLP